MSFLFFLLAAYLCGSVCSAVIVCRLHNLPDPRTEGSNNPGATNVLRIAGKKYAAIVLLVDLLKGFIPVFIASLFHLSFFHLGLIGLAAVLGHIFPVFFGFKGGKGVATALGVILACNFSLGIIVIATWLLVANFGHYSSLASLVSLCAAPFYATMSAGQRGLFFPLLLIAVCVAYKHRDNITRLAEGSETKIRFFKSK